MSLTVHEALDLKALERFKLVAGINGLNNRISRVGLIDHESVEQVLEYVIPGEFLFSNMMMIKDQPEKMLEYVKAVIQTKASCFAIKTIFFDGYPDEVIEYANKHKFPLFTFDETYIENIILDIDQALNVYSQLAKLRGYIDDMIQNEGDPLKVRTLALKLNKHFSNHFIAATVNVDALKMSAPHLVGALHQFFGKRSTVLEYEDDILLIYASPQKSVSSEDDASMLKFVLDGLKSSGIDMDTCAVGISSPMHTLSDMGRALLESRYALEYARFSNSNLSVFKDLGIYQLLIPNRNNPWFYAYYEEKIQTLVQYDERHDSDLLKTAQVFIECDANMKETAERLFQHVNTVRYRIKKIRELLGIEDLRGMQYESLAIAIHLYKLHSM